MKIRERLLESVRTGVLNCQPGVSRRRRSSASATEPSNSRESSPVFLAVDVEAREWLRGTRRTFAVQKSTKKATEPGRRDGYADPCLIDGFLSRERTRLDTVGVSWFARRVNETSSARVGEGYSAVNEVYRMNKDSVRLSVLFLPGRFL